MRRWAVRIFYAELIGELLGWLIYRRFTRTTTHRTATGKATP